MKPVKLTREDVILVEQAAQALIARGGVRDGFRLLSRCLAWRYDSGLGGEVFQCDVDESAGLAEAYELHGYSQKAPCA